MNKFKKYKSLRGPSYSKTYPYSFFGPTTNIFKHIYNIYIYIYIYINKFSSSSSSSCRAGSTDISDPLSPLLPIVHRPR